MRTRSFSNPTVTCKPCWLVCRHPFGPQTKSYSVIMHWDRNALLSFVNYDCRSRSLAQFHLPRTSELSKCISTTTNQIDVKPILLSEESDNVNLCSSDIITSVTSFPSNIPYQDLRRELTSTNVLAVVWLLLPAIFPSCPLPLPLRRRLHFF